jgi:hypothetical protein
VQYNTDSGVSPAVCCYVPPPPQNNIIPHPWFSDFQIAINVMFSVTQNTVLQDEYIFCVLGDSFTLKFREGLVFGVSCGIYTVFGRLLCSGGEVCALLVQTVCCVSFVNHQEQNCAVEHNINEISNFVEQSPSWEADSSSACQEIPHILLNLNLHYRVHNSPPLVFNVSQVTFSYGKGFDTI